MAKSLRRSLAKRRKKTTKKPSLRDYGLTSNPLKKIRVAESKIQNREITQKEAAIRFGVSLSVYQAYERKTNPHEIPEYLVRLIEFGALRSVGLVNEHGALRKSKLQLEIDIWNKTIRTKRISQ